MTEPSKEAPPHIAKLVELGGQIDCMIGDLHKMMDIVYLHEQCGKFLDLAAEHTIHLEDIHTGFPRARAVRARAVAHCKEQADFYRHMANMVQEHEITEAKKTASDV